MKRSAIAMPVSIRSRLLLLVLLTLLPAALGVIWLLARTYEAEHEAYTRALIDSTRALSQVIDREISMRVAVAHVLAQSRFLDRAPELSPQALQRFEQVAHRSLAGMEGWIELRTADRLLLTTRSAAYLQPLAPAELASDAVTASAGLAETPRLQPLHMVSEDAVEAHAAVIEPVERGGRVVLNLVLAIRPQELQRIIDMQDLPPGWVGTVMDSRGIVVARHPGGEMHVGRRATPDLLERMGSSSEGLFQSVSLDGHRTYGYFSTASHGWTYLNARPRPALTNGLSRALLEVGLGALVLLGLALLGARWVSLRISGPVCELKTTAGRMQAGEPIEFHPTGLIECDEVAMALSDADKTLREARGTLEQRVGDAVERTRQAEQRAAQSQRIEALGRLTGGVAHDFNNLLGVISNGANLIQRHPAASELELPLAAVMRSVEAGSQLTQHLLRFSGRRSVSPQPVNLVRWLPELHGLIRSVVLGRTIEITVQVAPDTALVLVDAAELELALVNLALNARDAMPAGGELRMQARNALPPETAELAGHPRQSCVLIAISDDGVGIAPECIDRVFDPFFTTKDMGKGTGLGLSQVHGFCTQAGGTARVASTPGLGTTVSLLLPAHAGGDRPNELPEQVVSDTPLLARARLLLVEDNVELGRITQALLQAHVAQVTRVTDAARALRALDAGPAFDVVLSDVVMPGPMDGVQLAHQLRRERPDLPVVLISGYSETAAGAADFVVLRKPCAVEHLLSALNAALATRSKPSEG